jgi:hypothetical protein
MSGGHDMTGAWSCHDHLIISRADGYLLKQWVKISICASEVSGIGKRVLSPAFRRLISGRLKAELKTLLRMPKRDLGVRRL